MKHELELPDPKPNTMAAAFMLLLTYKVDNTYDPKDLARQAFNLAEAYADEKKKRKLR